MSSLNLSANTTTLVVFGASGDLTQRKLVPALYNNFKKGRLAGRLRVVGVARRDWDTNQFRDRLRDGARQHSAAFDESSWETFAREVNYVRGNLEVSEDYHRLHTHLSHQEGGPADRIYYLATAPDLYGPACDHLAAAGMVAEDKGFRRIIIEKPFGRDLASARQLNQKVHAAFREDQVYRIDHYLGKETAQNIFFLRFANTIFEPVMFNLSRNQGFTPNFLAICIQPNEGIHLRFETKVPDKVSESRSVHMSYSYSEGFPGVTLPDAYERLLLDAIKGDASLFARSDIIETAWRLIDPVIAGWESSPEVSPLQSYAVGSWGPSAADALPAREGHAWRMDCCGMPCR